MSIIQKIIFWLEGIKYEMRCNDAGITLIRQFEGYSDKAYQDGNGIWTIGYGHTRGIQEGDVCTQDQAVSYLISDLANVEAGITRLVKRPLSSNQFSALCSLVFNIGLSHFGASSALQLLNMANMAAVPAAMAKWNIIKGQVSDGLVRRRSAEIRLFNTPDNA